MQLSRTARGAAIGAAALAITGLHVGAAAFFATRNPYTSEVFPPCPILAITGWQCPGCGGTRSAYSLLHGDLLASVAMNPLVLAIYLALALVGVGAVLRTRAPRVSAALQYSAPVVIVGAVLYSAVVRNLLPG
jgi:hypothetical protein